MKITIDGRVLWINYHHLYCFYVIASEGSLSKASQLVGIGPSALSIQMRQFEEHLGFPLFERSHRKLRLNERGGLVLTYAKEIFRLGGEMIEAVHDRPTAKRLHLQVGALDMIPKHLTVQLVDEAIRKKNCSISVIEGKPEYLLRALTEYRLDLVLTNDLPVTESGHVYSKRIARLALWVAGGKSFLELKAGFPHSLNGHKFIVPTRDSRVRHEFDHFCKRLNIKIDDWIETQDVMIQKLLALKGIGLIVVPEFAVREYLLKKELFLIGKLEKVFEELYLIASSRRVENPVASFLMGNFKVK